ncbi:MAG: hypothetical protein ACTSO7_05590 [Candidatus Heimdallarchaeota archaeon]
MRKLKFPLVVWLSYIAFLVISLLLATILPYISHITASYKAEIHFTGLYKEIYETTKIVTKIPSNQFLPITTVLILIGLLLIVISSLTIGPIFSTEKLTLKTKTLIVNISRFTHVVGSLIGMIGIMYFVCYTLKNELLNLYHFSAGFIFTAIILITSLLVSIFTIFIVEDKNVETV